MFSPVPAFPALTTPAWCMDCAQAPAVALMVLGHVAFALQITPTGEGYVVPGPWLLVPSGGYLCGACLDARLGLPVWGIYLCPGAPGGAP